MNGVVIAFDTATEAVAVGIARIEGGNVTDISGGAQIAPRQANALLLRSVLEALSAAQASLADVVGVVVGRGPGSFTGVRIGVAAAKGLAQGLGVPLAGVGTLDAIAHRFADADGIVGVVGDAMRGEVYPALFRVSAGKVERMTVDRVARPDEVARQWADALSEPLTLTGNGLAKHATLFRSALGARACVAPRDLWWPDGWSLVATFLAHGGLALFRDGDPGLVLPIYTRLSDAEEAERARKGLGRIDPPPSGVAGEPGEGGRP